MKRINYNKGRLWWNYRIVCNHCGATMNKPVWWLKLQYIFHDKLYYTCPYCHKTSCYTTFFNMMHETTDTEEKEINKFPRWDERIR